MMKHRVYNFTAGPATLPEPVLRDAQNELLNWKGMGMSVMEIGHRTPAFRDLLDHAESTLRALLGIPANYHVLFLGGAARTQFAMIPLNFLGEQQKAGYLISGVWSQMAFDEAVRLKNAYCAGTSKSSEFTTLPQYSVSSQTRYVYYTPNETVNGVQFSSIPQVNELPLVADMTSCLLTEPIDVSNFSLIFAGAQKNIAPAGLTVVIIQDEFMQQITSSKIPTMLDYRVHAKHHSLYATPPTFNCYMADKMFTWIRAQGGIEALYKVNCQKAEKLYEYIDHSKLFKANVDKKARSKVNVCFTMTKPELEEAFCIQAEASGLYGLKGHRLVGGLRASLYNAMPIEGVNALIEFMHQFEKKFQ